MENLLTILFCCFMILVVTSLVQAEQQSTTCVHAIVLDTSPTREWNQIRKTAENIYEASIVGDTILLFAVRGGDTQLLFSCTKSGVSHEISNFHSALKTVTSDWFLIANIDRALDGPVRDRLLQHLNKKGLAILFIISDGNFNNKQALSICRFVDNVKTIHNWPMLITGTTEKTNRQFLIAAGKGHLHWCKLADATDFVFLEKLIRKIRPRPPAIAGNITFPKPIVVPHEEIPPSEKSIPEATENSLKVRELPAILEPNNPVSTTASGVEKPQVLKAVFEKTILEPNLASKPNVFKSPPSFAVQKVKNTESAEIDTVKEESQASVVNREKQPIATSTSEKHAETSPKENSKALFPSRILRLDSLKLCILAVGGLSVIAATAFMVYGFASATNWQRKLKNPLAIARQKEEKQPKLLMARVGISSHCLGNPKHFHSAHVGSSSQNTIQINSKVIAPRHLRLYRRGSNFFIHNLAKTTVVANGQEIRQNKRFRLTLPAAVNLCEGLDIRLFLAKKIT